MSIFGGLFWGVFLLAAGLIIMLKLVFNLQVSAGKLIVGLLILMIGVSLLMNSAGWSFFDKNAKLNSFSSGQVTEIVSPNEYTVVFGSSTYDASGLKPGDTVKINCAFGSCRVILPKGDVYVTASCAFGSVRLPDGRNFSFNSSSYGKDKEGAVRVDISCAFGSINVTDGD
jgi:hypothetical protein